MKKLFLIFSMIFFMSPIINASESEVGDALCHEIAKGYADYMGYEGIVYAVNYLDAYNVCVEQDRIENEEEIIHPD